jgi:hypothetical protein
VGCLRLDSIVRAGRLPREVLASLPPVSVVQPDRAVFEDSHGVKVVVGNTEAGVIRLLAEVLARVPWAVGYFDEQAERSATPEEDRVVAQGQSYTPHTPA